MHAANVDGQFPIAGRGYWSGWDAMMGTPNSEVAELEGEPVSTQQRKN